jgi:hypothetical protein
MTTTTNPTQRLNTGGTFRWIRVADLNINPLAQRELRPGWANEIARQFQASKMGVLLVSERDGRYFVVDGQHRVEALRLLGRNNTSVYCCVHTGLTEAEEADQFLGHNNTKKVDAYNKFAVGVTAGRPDELDISAIVAECGLRIGRGDGSLSCVAALRRVYGYSPDALRRTLTVVYKSFGDHGQNADYINGVGLFLHRFGELVDDTDLTHRLTTLPGGMGAINSLVSKARSTYGKPVPQSLACVLTELANKGRRSKQLPSWWS